MSTPTKLATCCYCSARTLLKPTARDGHELACASCGAPLHEMKWLKAPATSTPAPAQRKAKSPKKSKLADWSKSAPPRKKPKKRKSLFFKVLEEAWDLADDIFD